MSEPILSVKDMEKTYVGGGHAAVSYTHMTLPTKSMV